jgi:hypothetical protein
MGVSSSVERALLAAPLAALLACGDPVPYFREVRLDRPGNPACIEEAVRASIPGAASSATVDTPPPWLRAIGDQPMGTIDTERGGAKLSMDFVPYDEPRVIRYISRKRQTGLEEIDAEIAKRCHTRVEVKKEQCYRAKCP